MQLDDFLSRLDGVRQAGGGHVAKCPAHDDKRQSLSLSEGEGGRILLNCHAGCEPAAVVTALDLKMADLFSPSREEEKKAQRRVVECYDYTDEAGGLLFQVCRTEPKGFFQRRPDGRGDWVNGLGDTRRVLYRLPAVIEAIKQNRRVFVVEGEKDVHALEKLGLVATTNAAGAGKWRDEYSEALRGAHVTVLPDHDESGRKHAETVSAALVGVAASVTVVHLPDLPPKGDVSDWIAAGGTAEQLKELVKNPPPPPLGIDATAQPVPPKPASQAENGGCVSGCAPEADTQPHNRSQEELRKMAAQVLKHPDPYELVKAGISASGYGGDVRIPLIVYLAATSRLLKMIHGAMPVHLCLIGQASAGKSYAASAALNYMPEDAVHTIEAASPRVLIYDKANLKHRVVLFGEADSIPSDEDNPAASAIRNLLQEHRLHYKVVDDKREVRTISKEGPSVLITTTTKPLGEQLMSRLFRLDIPDGQEQTKAALHAQADLEINGPSKLDQSLIDFQKYLRTLAPIDVIVPFADRLAEAIGKRPTATRIKRDFARLLSLIKSVAVLRMQHRERTEAGRVIATLEDYATVRELIGDMFEASASGASQIVRETVGKVSELIEAGQKHVTAKELADVLDVHKSTATTRARSAIRAGFLVNAEERRGRPYKLELGDPLPSDGGLPSIEELQDRLRGCADGKGTQPLTQPLKSADLQGEQKSGCAVAPVSEGRREAAAEETLPELSELRAQGRLTI